MGSVPGGQEWPGQDGGSCPGHSSVYQQQALGEGPRVFMQWRLLPQQLPVVWPAYGDPGRSPGSAWLPVCWRSGPVSPASSGVPAFSPGSGASLTPGTSCVS